MKRYVLIIGLWAAGVALPNMLQAQWSFTASVTKTGAQTTSIKGLPVDCGISYGLINAIVEQSPKTFPTKEQCESSRQSLINRSDACSRVICGPCSGSGGGSDGDKGAFGRMGNADITGTNQGNPFYTSNEYEATQEAYEQKRLLMEKTLSEENKNENISQYPLSNDRDYNNHIVRVLPKGTLAKGRGIGVGRPSGFVDYSSSRQQENSSAYVSQGTYRGTLQSWAESAGLNIAAYFSEEEWNKCSDSRTLTSSACSGFREDYNRFLHDVFEKQKKQDPIFSGNVVDEAWASTKEKLKEEAIIRAQGAMQMIGGASDIVGGYAIATGGEIFVPGVSAMAGTIVAVNGADNFRAGMYQFFTGYKSKTLASAIESRFRLPQNSINNATAILSLGASAYSFSKSVIKYSAKPRINATVFPSNRAVVEGVRRSSTTMGGKIITPGRTGLQTGKMMGMQSLSPIRQSAKHTKDITSFQNETGITLRQAIDTRIAENAKTVQTAADKNGISNYPDVDDWIAGRIPAGTKIYTALPGGDGNFYAIIDDNINTVQMYRDRLQIMPPDATKGHGERFIIGGYKVTKDIDVAVSRALANPQYGQGGGWQLYLGPNDVRTSLRVDIVDPKLLQK